MIAFLAYLIAALVALPAPTQGGPPPPRSYQLEIEAAYADVSVTMNGLPLLTKQAERDQVPARLLLNGFLKATGNELVITITPAFPGNAASGSAKLTSFLNGGGEASIRTQFETPGGKALTAPLDKIFRFDAPDVPRLAFWSAEDARLDAAGEAVIAATLADFQSQVIAGLNKRDTRAVVSLFANFSGNRDAAFFTGDEDAATVVAGLVDRFAPIINAPETHDMAWASAPGAGQLRFQQVGRHVIVSRKDRSPMLGFMFRGEEGPGGLTIDRPVFGQINGKWTMLQDIPLERH